MGKTSIEWADFTFNPWTGCTKVSDACKNCYAEAWAKRSGLVQWGDQAERRRTSESNWRQPLKWNREAEKAGERRRVFCASLADVFEDHSTIMPGWRADLGWLIENTPHLDWLLLTKRPENISRMLPDFWVNFGSAPYRIPQNVRLGVTAENQEMFDKRFDALRGVSANGYFLSIEPMLGPIDLRLTVKFLGGGEAVKDIARKLWVIAGGESGPHARPSHPDWFRDLRDQCVAAQVPFLFKQWGEWKPFSEMTESENNALYRSNRKAEEDEDQDRLDDAFGRTCKVDDSAIGYGGHIGYDRAFYSVDGHPGMQIFKVGKKAAGRLLDGRTWDEFPQITT